MIDEFYSENETDGWKLVLNPNMDYHFGYPRDVSSRLFEKPLLSYLNFIGDSKTLLDVGCGWGGPARTLKNNSGLDITCVTNSIKQFEFVRNEFKVINANANNLLLDETYDVTMFIESFTHMEDKAIQSIKSKKIIIKDFSNDVKTDYHDEWKMRFRSYSDWKSLFDKNSLKIVDYKKYDKSAFKPACEYWLENIKKLETHTPLYGQLKLLKKFCLFQVSNHNNEYPYNSVLFLLEKN